MTAQNIKIAFLMFLSLAITLSFVKLDGRLELSYWIIWSPVIAIPAFFISFAIYRATIFRLWGKKNLQNKK